VKKFLLAVALMAAASMLAASVATATSEVHKVFVCKYVGKPGVDERLQTGNNPISVDSNAPPTSAATTIEPGLLRK